MLCENDRLNLMSVQLEFMQYAIKKSKEDKKDV